MILSGFPISSTPISALGAASLTRSIRRSAVNRPADVPPDAIHGQHHATRNFHTGLAEYYTFRKGRRYHQPFFSLNLLKPHTHRRRVDVHFTFVPPHAPPHKPHHQAWFPADLLAGSFMRHRVPGSGLTAIPVRQRSRIYHQAWFPADLLKGGHRRVFPQAHIEIVVELECPDRRHFADELRELYGTTELTDVLAGDADEAYAFSGVADQSDVQVGVADSSDSLFGDTDSADVLVGVSDSTEGFYGAVDAGDVVVGVADVLATPLFAAAPVDDSLDGVADQADSFSGRVDQCL